MIVAFKFGLNVYISAMRLTRPANSVHFQRPPLALKHWQAPGPEELVMAS